MHRMHHIHDMNSHTLLRAALSEDTARQPFSQEMIKRKVSSTSESHLWPDPLQPNASHISTAVHLRLPLTQPVLHGARGRILFSYPALRAPLPLTTT